MICRVLSIDPACLSQPQQAADNDETTPSDDDRVILVLWKFGFAASKMEQQLH